ncbi:MAG: PQQ-dependent sugar dehydrogenase, partial [Planctomycetota bacterium]
MLKLRTASRRFLPLAFFVLFLCQSLYALPTGFIEQTVGSGWNQVVGLTFADDGRMFVWERGGRIWIYENGAKQLFLDISDEVGGWRDYGLLGVALHPNFYNTGHVYLLY